MKLFTFPYIKFMDDLNYFIGKACTICTVMINYRYKPEQMFDYFMGFIESIDEKGMLITHPVTKCKSYIFLAHIVSISEEQVLYEDDPKDAKIIEEFRAEKPLTAQKTTINQKEKFMNPERMAEVARKAQERFKK